MRMKLLATCAVVLLSSGIWWLIFDKLYFMTKRVMSRKLVVYGMGGTYIFYCLAIASLFINFKSYRFTSWEAVVIIAMAWPGVLVFFKFRGKQVEADRARFKQEEMEKKIGASEKFH